MSKWIVTMKEIHRYKVLKEIIEKKLTAKEASSLLSLSYRHTLRLKHRIIKQGFEGILKLYQVLILTKKYLFFKFLRHIFW